MNKETKRAFLEAVKSSEEDTLNKKVKSVAKSMGIPYSKNLYKNASKWLRGINMRGEYESNADFDSTTETHTNQYNVGQPKLSALKPDGTIMTIDEFCRYHGLDPQHSKSYKLVTHTGVPYYNIASVNLDTLADEVDWEGTIKRVLSEVWRPAPLRIINKFENDYVMQIILSDVHVGMDTNPDSKSLYGGKWDKESLMHRLDRVLEKVTHLRSIYGTFREVQMIDLGDFCDGLDGQTVRRGHELPQNMSNEEMFETGLSFKLKLVDGVTSIIPAGKYVMYNVCNSNHSSSFDYMTNRAAEECMYHAYEDSIDITNELKFIGHRVTGNWVDVFCHGKDESHLKFGLKPKLDDKGKGYIEDYLKHHGLLGSGKHIVFHSGDSHLRIQDSATSLDFDYHKYLSFAPASSWVQGNFGRSRSGFTIIVKDMYKYEQHIHNYEFEWNSDNLK